MAKFCRAKKNMSYSCSCTIFTTSSPFVFCKSAYCLIYIFLFSISNAHISAKISEVEWSFFPPTNGIYMNKQNSYLTMCVLRADLLWSIARRRMHIVAVGTQKTHQKNTGNIQQTIIIINLYLHFFFVADCRRFRKSLQRRRHRNRNETIISVRSD